MKCLNLLCFSCGRVEHKKGGCPYIVRTPLPVKVDGTKAAPEVEVENLKMSKVMIPMDHGWLFRVRGMV